MQRGSREHGFYILYSYIRENAVFFSLPLIAVQWLVAQDL